MTLPTSTSFNKQLVIRCAAIIVFLLTANIYFSVLSLHTAHQSARLESEKASLLQKKKMLTQEYANSFSLAEMDAYAQQKGFVPVNKTLSLQLPSDQAVALR